MNAQLLLLFCTAVFLAAGLVKGVSGMGLPTLAMALLTLVLPPAQAAGLMVLPALLTNVAQCFGGHGALLWRRLWPMWAALAVATLWSPLPGLDAGGAAHALLGGVLIVYGLWGLAKPRLPEVKRWPRALGAVAGLLSGLLTAATGVFVMPMVPWLQALRLDDKAALMQAMGISFTIATLALAARLGRGLPAVPLPAVAVAVTAAFIGMALGRRLLGRLQPATFQRIVYAVFALLGVLMLLNG